MTEETINEIQWNIHQTHPDMVKPAREKLAEVVDPEIGMNIIQLGLVRDIIIENDIARMRPVSVLHVGANEVVLLEPSGLHIMLFGLKKPLLKNQAFPLELVFEISGKQKVTVKVREN